MMQALRTVSVWLLDSSFGITLRSMSGPAAFDGWITMALSTFYSRVVDVGGRFYGGMLCDVVGWVGGWMRVNNVSKRGITRITVGWIVTPPDREGTNVWININRQTTAPPPTPPPVKALTLAPSMSGLRISKLRHSAASWEKDCMKPSFVFAEKK